MTLSLIVGLIGLAMLAVERARPGRDWPRVAGWWPRALAFNALQVAIVFAAGRLWDGWMLAHRPFTADALGVLGGALVGYLAITFVYYGWHRARHASPWLWRVFHQLHHSPQRLEVVTSFYKHPLEIAVNGVLSSAVLYLGVGLSPAAAALAIGLTGVAELVYHWNVRTPYWLGFFFQRPESHCVHHERGRHTSNFSDLPLWDMLFGTFENPRVFEGACGFAEDAEREVRSLLLGRDVSGPDRARATAPALANTTSGQSESRWRRAAIAALVGLGLLQMAASATGLHPLAGLAAATGASPRPKVFSSVEGLETFSTRFTLAFEDSTGRPHAVVLTPELYARIAGPYNRRNAYGALLAYGPALLADERTHVMAEAASRHALCGDAPLLHELGLVSGPVRGAVRVQLTVRPGTETELPLDLEVSCS